MRTIEQFRDSLSGREPDGVLSPPLQALWWVAKGEWQRAHALVDDLETREAMQVHAYLHRKEGDQGNAAYWYRRAGVAVQRCPLEDEWPALAQALLAKA